MTQDLLHNPKFKWGDELKEMINLKYSLIIEATSDPLFFSFYSPDLEGFTGVGHSIEDCIYKAKWGMEEHLETMKELGVSIPPPSKKVYVLVQNEGTVQQNVASLNSY